LGSKRQQSLLPIGNFAAERASSQCQRRAPLAFGFGKHQVGQSLDPGKIELAIIKGAARELTRAGRAQTGDSAERVEQRPADCPAAVNLKFGDVVARFAMRRRKVENQSVINDFTGVRVAKGDQFGAARLRSFASKRHECRRRLRAAHSDDTDCGRWLTRR